MDKTYKVTISYTEYAIIEVNASSEQDAENIAYTMLEQEGVPHDANTTDRDYSVDYVEDK
jgi:hypothetical protein